MEKISKTTYPPPDDDVVDYNSWMRYIYTQSYITSLYDNYVQLRIDQANSAIKGIGSKIRKGSQGGKAELPPKK